MTRIGTTHSGEIKKFMAKSHVALSHISKNRSRGDIKF